MITRGYNNDHIRYHHCDKVGNQNNSWFWESNLSDPRPIWTTCDVSVSIMHDTKYKCKFMLPSQDVRLRHPFRDFNRFPCHSSGILCQKQISQVSRAGRSSCIPQILWDVTTCSISVWSDIGILETGLIYFWYISVTWFLYLMGNKTPLYQITNM